MSNQPNLRALESAPRRMRIKSIEKKAPIEVKAEDYGLSPLEKRIIALLLAGYSTKESARINAVSERSVRRHLRRILAKLGVANPLELLLFAAYYQLTGPVQQPLAATHKKKPIAVRAEGAA